MSRIQAQAFASRLGQEASRANSLESLIAQRRLGESTVSSVSTSAAVVADADAQQTIEQQYALIGVLDAEQTRLRKANVELSQRLTCLQEAQKAKVS